MSDREKLEALFQDESKLLLHEKRSQACHFQQSYMLMVLSAETEEERKRLIADYEKEVNELRELLSD